MARAGGRPGAKMAVLYRNHHDSVLLQAELVARGIPLHRPERAPVLRAGARQGRAGLSANPGRERPRRAGLATAPDCSSPASARRSRRRCTPDLAAEPDPLAALATAETMALVPAEESKGHFAGFVSRPSQAPGRRSPSRAPPTRSRRSSRGAIRRSSAKYERPDQSASPTSSRWSSSPRRYDSPRPTHLRPPARGRRLRRPTPVATGLSPTEHLVLSSIHQAKGLEWAQGVRDPARRRRIPERPRPQ